MDILADWKNKKFVFINYIQTDPHLAVLTDVEYWNNNWDELIEWSKTHNCNVQGMTVALPDEKTKFLFVLRWV